MASVGACISTGSVTDTWFFPLHSQQSSHILKMYCWCRTHLHTLFSGEGKYSCQLSDCRLLAQHDCTSPEHRHYITVGFLIRVQFLPIGLKKNCITMPCELKILCIKIKFTQMCVICNTDNDIWHYLARCEGKSSNGVIQLVFWWKWTFDSFLFLCATGIAVALLESEEKAHKKRAVLTWKELQNMVLIAISHFWGFNFRPE